MASDERRLLLVAIGFFLCQLTQSRHQHREFHATPVVHYQFERRRLASSAEGTGQTPKVMKAFDREKYGDDALIVAIMSDRANGIIVSVSAIIRHSNLPVHLVLVCSEEITQKVNGIIGNRLASLNSFTLEDADFDLARNGYKPMWKWPNYNASGEFEKWRNEKTVHTAAWDKLNTHIHPLNHIRFYLPHLTFFQGVKAFFFVDDDVLVQKDLGALLARSRADPRYSDKPIITMCSVWEWNGACNQFEFYDRELSIINSTVLYKWSTHTCNHEKQGDINSRTHLPLDDTYFAEVNCIPPSYDAWLNMVAPKALQQKSWNFGISIFNLESWRRKKMTPHYEELLQVNLRDHIFAETSLAFGLGISYLSFAGEVACLEDLNFTVLDGLGHLGWETFQMTFGTEEKAIAKLEAAGALHWSGPGKPWNIPRKVHPYMSRAWEYEAKLVNIATPPDVPPMNTHRQYFMFLTGPRSGSEWSMGLLDQHPLVCASGEYDSAAAGFSTEAIMPNAVMYPRLAHDYMGDCVVKKGCLWGFWARHLVQLSNESQQHRCRPDYDRSNDGLDHHLPRLCEAVRILRLRGARCARGWLHPAKLRVRGLNFFLRYCCEADDRKCREKTHFQTKNARRCASDSDINCFVDDTKINEYNSGMLKAWNDPQPILDLYIESLLQKERDVQLKMEGLEQNLVACSCSPRSQVIGFKAMEDWFGRIWKSDKHNDQSIPWWAGGFFHTPGHDELRWRGEWFQKAIRFRRKNLLQRIISLDIADRTGVFHARTDTERQKLHGVKARLDGGDMVAHLNYEEQVYRRMTKFLNGWGVRFIELFFEDCVKDPALCQNRMTDFLDIPRSPTPPKILMTKSVNESATTDVLDNTDKPQLLRHYIRYSGYQQLINLGDPDPSKALDCRNGIIGNASVIPPYARRRQGYYLCCASRCGKCGIVIDDGCRDDPKCCVSQIAGLTNYFKGASFDYGWVKYYKEPTFCKDENDVGCIIQRYS